MRLVRLFILHLTLIVVVIACKKKTSTIDVIPDVKKNHLQRNHIFGNVKNLESQTFIKIQYLFLTHLILKTFLNAILLIPIPTNTILQMDFL